MNISIPPRQGKSEAFQAYLDEYLRWQALGEPEDDVSMSRLDALWDQLDRVDRDIFWKDMHEGE